MKSESTKFENLTKSSFLECFSGWWFISVIFIISCICTFKLNDNKSKADMFVTYHSFKVMLQQFVHFVAFKG